MFPVRRASIPNSVCNYWVKRNALSFVSHPVKNVFNCCCWTLSSLLLRLFCVSAVDSSSAVCDCAWERNTSALFLLCCIFSVLPLSGSEGVKETWVIVVNVSVQALGLFKCWVMVHHIAYSTNSYSLAGSSLTSVASTHGTVCPVKVEHDVFLKVLPSSFADLESRRGVALLTVLLSFWYLLNYWDSFSCVIFCCLPGCPALSAMHLVYFFSKPAFNLLWIFISDLSVSSLEQFLNNHFLTPVCVRGDFVAGKVHSPLTLQVVQVLCSPRTAIPPLGVLTCSSPASVVSLGLHLLSVLLKCWSGKIPVSWQCTERYVCENDATTQEPARDYVHLGCPNTRA